MSNPANPAQASLPVPPPLVKLPWATTADGQPVMLTPMAFGFLQTLWAAAFGNNGVLDLESYLIAELQAPPFEFSSPEAAALAAKFAALQIPDRPAPPEQYIPYLPPDPAPTGTGSGVTFTDGSNTVADATTLTVTGGTVGGSTPSATLSISGGGSGLYSSVLSATPTVSSTGLANLLGTSAATADTSAGVLITGPSGFGAYTTTVPATPYSITTLTTISTAASVGGLGWTDGTKVQFIYINSGSTGAIGSRVVQSNSSLNVFSATNATSGVNFPALSWFRIRDDGTNVTFSHSMDGVNFTTIYTVAKSSGFLGSSGYSHIFVGNPGGGVAGAVTVMSWTQGT